ncbi:hypothetical protein ACM44_09240 [Chryseobacterium koreense CCUG 49689]|uniref:Uncharacterized protein n=1 Tax=Chryseobacterium koreense CCUG 49689 TaxID=1304281 RepID=A0A0J7IXT5_9FLAO|nr:hypothetical protein ACM44_09240 [Chryseobacterium koreense CCUG 49689]MBB5332550.1 hypothetical protein [Chryseobacterium koreense]
MAFFRCFQLPTSSGHPRFPIDKSRNRKRRIKENKIQKKQSEGNADPKNPALSSLTTGTASPLGIREGKRNSRVHCARINKKRSQTEVFLGCRRKLAFSAKMVHPDRRHPENFGFLPLFLAFFTSFASFGLLWLTPTGVRTPGDSGGNVGMQYKGIVVSASEQNLLYLPPLPRGCIAWRNRRKDHHIK